MKAMVTGSAGFVGKHLIKHLQSCGDNVLTTDQIDGGPDLLDVEGLINILVNEKPEVVFHLAGQADVGKSWDDPVTTLRVNAEGTLHLLNAARAVGTQRVVTVTSADIYGAVTSKELPITENAPLKPISPYAVSKAAADLIALQAKLGHGQDVIRARSFNHLGPGQSERFVCSAIAARIAKNEQTGKKILKVGNLEAQRDFTDVRDVVRAYRMLAISGKSGMAYNICSGKSVAIADIASKLLSMSKQTMELQTDPELLRPVDIPEIRGDPSRLLNDTGWEPTYHIDETLIEVINDWRERIITDSPAD